MKKLVMLVLIVFVILVSVVEADVVKTKVKISFDGKKTLEQAIFGATFVLDEKELQKLVSEARYSKDFPVKDSRKFKGDVEVELSVPECYLAEEMELQEEISLSKRTLTLFGKCNGKDIELFKAKVAVGAVGRSTKVGDFCLKRVVHLPNYFPPKEWGGNTGAIRSGPGNPYGLWYAEVLEVSPEPAGYEYRPRGVVTKNGFGQHSTNNPRSIGRRASHGCVRLHPKVAARLFPFFLRFTPHKEPKSGVRGKEIYPFEEGKMILVEIKK